MVPNIEDILKYVISRIINIGLFSLRYFFGNHCIIWVFMGGIEEPIYAMIEAFSPQDIIDASLARNDYVSL